MRVQGRARKFDWWTRFQKRIIPALRVARDEIEKVGLLEREMEIRQLSAEKQWPSDYYAM